MTLLGCLVWLVLAQTPSPQDAPARPSVAVLTLVPKGGVDANAMDLLSANLVGLLRDTGRFSRVVSTSEMEGLMGFEKQKQLLSCDSGSCMAELAGALGVDYLVTGSVGRLGTQYLVNLSLLHTADAAAEGSVSLVVEGRDEGVLVQALRNVPAQLLKTSKVPAGPGDAAPAKEPEMKSAPPAPPPSGVMVTVLKAVGGVGLGVSGVAVVVGLLGAAVALGLWWTVLLVSPITEGKRLGLPMTVAYLGGWGVFGVAALVAAVGLALGVGGLVAGVVLG